MRRIRVTGRFYIFLIAILIVAFLIIRPYLPMGTKEAIIVSATAAYTNKMDAVIVRDEDVFSSGTVARIEYVATEGTLLEPGDTIAYLYSTGYSEGELVKLETIRQNIQSYHKGILNNIGNKLGMKDLEVGYPDFDKEFVLKSNNYDKLKQFFSDQTIRSMIQAQKKIWLHIRKAYGDSIYEVYYEYPGTIKDAQTLKALFDLFQKSLDQLQSIGVASVDAPNISL
jgi:hypothetical protein